MPETYEIDKSLIDDPTVSLIVPMYNVREDVAECRRDYTPSKPPIAPKGYMYIGHETNQYGFLCFKYVRELAQRPPDRRPKGGRLKT